MREILFKAKAKDEPIEWVEGYLSKCEKEFIICDEQGVGIFIDFETICQYTGLTDKNGNKIWENDVVKDTTINLLGSVEYDEEHGMYVINEVNDGYQNFQEFWSCTEVIGNIFDNPELLSS